MIKQSVYMVKTFVVVAFVFAVTSAALASQHEAFTPSEKKAIEETIRAYLMENPEVIVDALRILDQRQKLAEAELSREQLIAREDEIQNDPASPVGWNLEGDVTIVEFFDYQCQYCRVVAPRLAALRSEDDEIRYVYKELPILGPVSEVAARAALAAHKQGLYEVFHDALMNYPGRIKQRDIFSVAKEVGLDIERLREDMKAPEIEASIARTRQLASALGINGTPAFVIGDQLVPGAVGIEQLRSLVRRARERS